MDNLATEILIVGGGPAGMAAAVAASESGKRITIVDDNPKLGGQIWRAEMGKIKSPVASKLLDAINETRIEIANNATVFAAPKPQTLAADTPAGPIHIEYEKLIIATGARERFLPFPGWTLPNVVGAAGLQALVKGGLDVRDKRIVVAGTGPLLLAVAEYLKSKGAEIAAIAEQIPGKKLRRFALKLITSPSKISEAVEMKSKLGGVPYLTECWVTKCGSPRVTQGLTSELRDPPSLKRGFRPKSGPPQRKLEVSLTRKTKTWTVECDYLACGFHLVPNLELISLLGCDIQQGFVGVDEFQRTSCENVFCAGEPTGIGAVEASIIEGTIAGYAVAGDETAARKYFGKREKTRRFAAALDTAFSLRDELKLLADEDTIVCRCEDVTYGRLKDFVSSHSAKLQTRCGMGSCQGRVCGAATEFLFGWKPGSVRPPIFPVRMENL